MSILRSGVGRKFYVRQARVLEEILVGADRHRREEIMRAGGGDDVVLIDAVAANADGADEHTVAIKRKTAGENRDAVRQIRNGTSAGKGEVGLGSGKPGKLILLSKKWSRFLAVDSRWIIFLRKKSDAARRHGDVQT